MFYNLKFGTKVELRSLKTINIMQTDLLLSTFSPVKKNIFCQTECITQRQQGILKDRGDSRSI